MKIIICIFALNVIIIYKNKKMAHQIWLSKMITEHSKFVEYYIKSEQHFINLNQFLGGEISLKKVGCKCIFCKKEVDQIYRMGHCYNCFWKSPQASDSILKPELSKAHLGIEVKDLEWERNFELQPHIVYLANSGNVKVGVTRKMQIQTRWIDQGAIAAIPIAEVPNRYTAGIIEVDLKEHFADKTHWKKMLSKDIQNIDLIQQKQNAYKVLREEFKNYFIEKNHLYHIKYPVEFYPEKINSINLEKQKKFTGILKGIKGQYLIFKCGGVFNIRNNEGVLVEMNIKK